MLLDIKVKLKAIINEIKIPQRPAAVIPAFTGVIARKLSAAADKIQVRYLVYLGLVLLPAVVSLGAYYGIIHSMDQLAAADRPENRLGRRGVHLTAEDFVKYAGRGEKEITALFIEAGMAPDSYRQNDGFTPLHAAAAYGRAPVVRLLADKGADLNVRDKDGQTPLMKAVGNNQADVVAALLQKGAGVTGADLQGNTVVTMAKARSDRKVLDILVKTGVLQAVEEDKAAPAGEETNKNQNQANTKQMVQLTKSVAAGSGRAGAAIAAATPPGEFTLAAGYVGNIKVGDSVESLYQRFGTHDVLAGEAYVGGRMYKVLRVYDQGRDLPSLTAFVAQAKDGQEQMITAIRLFDKRYRTADDIGVAATLGDLRQAGGISSIEYTDSLYAVAYGNRMHYELEISAESMPVAWLNGGDTGSLPDNMKIRSIFLF
ncbi:ankyrin repeat domain-containing protein [Sporomusa termitida]|uniref:Ankyrin repeats (Many copies) n=1 Tax=Sporomusa termitida TaxID=2377 RepID=A0A517DPG5_9FIRM|nr:ankyrin repeat domain-containing protein [Sporomusa termitida]QDR79198.1 Ankyrin repeats (many copies) [Sporomusa termitida]